MKTGGKNLYKKSGVNIAKGQQFVSAIANLVTQTNRKGVDYENEGAKFGGFGSVFDLKATGYKDPLLVASTDGVGTKLLLAQAANKLDCLGQDLVAMCVNDLIAQGAEPLFFLDYIACGSLDIDKMQKIVAGISDACTKSGCALIGGETAEMPQLYKNDDFDLAGFTVGAVERSKLLPKNNAETGDIVLGLASSGIHANGFSLVRKILGDNNLSSDKTLLEKLLSPTRLYVKPILEILHHNFKVCGIAHITGGGLIENLPRALIGKQHKIKIDYKGWQLPEIFSYLQNKGGISDEEMRNVFNCGIGMALIVAEQEAVEVKNQLEKLGEKIFTIGEIIPA